MIDGPKKRVNILLPKEVMDRLSDLAAQAGCSLPSYIRQVLWRYLCHLDSAPNDPDHWRVLPK